eukprot:TRINITY_DN17531_c0_g1_i1.p1 TRINITY_DN17531_c0_g1~~TRINITY_DN17531_c0_g1_i1.p1  ORF type:complete len:280 (-),score=6.00 TRINITY_DN17531_c0_g1_i1:4-792(-)
MPLSVLPAHIISDLITPRLCFRDILHLAAADKSHRKLIKDNVSTFAELQTITKENTPSLRYKIRRLFLHDPHPVFDAFDMGFCAFFLLGSFFLSGLALFVSIVVPLYWPFYDCFLDHVFFYMVYKRDNSLDIYDAYPVGSWRHRRHPYTILSNILFIIFPGSVFITWLLIKAIISGATIVGYLHAKRCLHLVFIILCGPLGLEIVGGDPEDLPRYPQKIAIQRYIQSKQLHLDRPLWMTTINHSIQQQQQQYTMYTIEMPSI